MQNTTTTALALIHIEKVKNLHIDKIELATATHLYIEKVKSLHVGKIELTTTGASCNEQPTTHREPSTNHTLTNSQLVLACYYLVLSWDIRPRVDIDIADIARFILLATGKPYTNIDNSDFYKKLQRAPHLKSDRGLIKDLEVVQNLFLQLGLQKAYSLIEKEIIIIRQATNKHPK